MESKEKVLLEGEEMERAMTRMAHEILEKIEKGQDFALVGIESRGGYLVKRIAQRINSFNSGVVAVGTMDVTPFRDDLVAGSAAGSPIPISFPFSLDDRVVFLVDDVLYTGRTTRVALDLITQMGKPTKVLVAVLVDRGDRELPIRADIVGKNVRVSEEERVNVLFREADGIDRVVVGGETPRKIRQPSPS